MNETLLRHWWLLGLRGVLAIVFGVLALVWPAITLVTLAVLFAAFALVGGAAWTFAALRNRTSDERWWVLLILGAVSLAAGVAAALYPALTAVVLVLLVGANALVSGVVDLAVAVRVRRYMHGEWLLALNGIACILFGLLVLLFPAGLGALALAWMIGLYAILTGILLTVLSLRVRKWSSLNEARSSPAAGAAALSEP